MVLPMTQNMEPDARTMRRVRKALRKATSTDAGMRRFLDDLIGVGNYSYDPKEDVWIAPNSQHTGPGRGFIVIRRGGNWFSTVIPDGEIS
jgi:hypothetical protein